MTDWQDAKSSMMKSFRYVDEHDVEGVPFGTLEITWTNGSVGAYLEVNRRTYEDFAASESRGKFLNSQIKPNFAYKRQEAVDEPETQEQAKTPEEPPDAT